LGGRGGVSCAQENGRTVLCGTLHARTCLNIQNQPLWFLTPISQHDVIMTARRVAEHQPAMINVVSISAGNRDTHVRPDLSALCPQEPGKKCCSQRCARGLDSSSTSFIGSKSRPPWLVQRAVLKIACHARNAMDWRAADIRSLVRVFRSVACLPGITSS
jgi:hypothetical protein